MRQIKYIFLAILITLIVAGCAMLKSVITPAEENAQRNKRTLKSLSIFLTKLKQDHHQIKNKINLIEDRIHQLTVHDKETGYTHDGTVQISLEAQLINDKLSQINKKPVKFIEVKAGEFHKPPVGQLAEVKSKPAKRRVFSVPSNVTPIIRNDRYVVHFTFGESRSLHELSKFLSELGYTDMFSKKLSRGYRLYLGSFRHKDRAVKRIMEIRKLTGLKPSLKVNQLDS